MMSRDEAIQRIRKALKRRSGKAWSVTGGRGTAYGWLEIDVPPAKRTWAFRETGERDASGFPVYEEYDTGQPGHHASPTDRAELAALLSIPSVHHQGHSIPASSDYWQEYIDRAEGRTPSVIGHQYWD
jgi:hypothetical protein